MANFPFHKVQTGQLSKLTLLAYKFDEASIDKGTSDANSAQGSFLTKLKSNKGNLYRKTGAKTKMTVMYNPSKFSRSYSLNTIDKNNSSNVTGGTEVKGQENDKIKFDLVFDVTGASPSPGIDSDDVYTTFSKSKDGVEAIINDFLDLTYRINVTGHEQDVLVLIWGPNKFIGRLDSVNITYKLFDSGGTPIRADVSATFTACDFTSIKEANQKLQSPDITKTRTVKAGDTLLLLTKQMYDDESLYLEVARINNLRNYRRLKPGQVLVFPPINQKEN